MLLIITNTGDELFRFINIDDIKEVFSEFFTIFGCSTHFKSET